MPSAHQLGRYQLLDRIAFGGMAEIFRAKTFDAEGHAYLVAVKRVLNHLTEDDEFLRMLVDEARLTASLEHENIARVYEFVHDGDEYFIAMEYIDGKDVRSLVERQRSVTRPVPPELVAFVAMQVARALQAAHTKQDSDGRPLQIVHRDVSPSNVLLSYRGEVKLCDFGIAKATTTQVHTKTGIIKGKIRYMSPEQAMGKRLDNRSDLFSLGSIMYEMLTLTAPFTASTEVELIFAVRDARRADARTLEPSIPEALNDILNCAMSPSLSERFQSGEEMADALQQFLDQYRPGFRRSHLGRHLRQLFAADIERELRLLEEYVIETADPTKVGENLIADALGAGAPYTQFSASATGSRDNPLKRSGLHTEPTLIFGAGWPRRAPGLHEAETQIKSSRRSSFEQPGLHERETQILDRPRAVAVTPINTASTEPDLPAFDDSDDLDGFNVPEPLPALEPSRPRRDTKPDVDEPTTVPQGDEDER